MDFNKCNSSKEIMDMLFSDPKMAYFSLEKASERFNQIGCTEEAIKFYVLAKNTEFLEGFKLSVENLMSLSLTTAGQLMLEASEKNNTAARIMESASEIMGQASQRMMCR